MLVSLLALGDSLVASRHAPSADTASSAPAAASESTATPSPASAPTPAAQPALPTPMSVAAVALGRDDDADSVGGVDDDQYDSEAEEHYQRRASTAANAANASLAANADPTHATNAGQLEAQRLRGRRWTELLPQPGCLCRMNLSHVSVISPVTVSVLILFVSSPRCVPARLASWICKRIRSIPQR